MGHAVQMPHLKSPSFNLKSISEGLRLFLIVASLSFVVLAGQFAQSRGGQQLVQSTSAAENQTQKNPVVAKRVHHAHQISSLERFATAQVKNYEELLDGLTERAEVLLSEKKIDSLKVLELKGALRDLDETLMTTQQALSGFQATEPTADQKEAAFAEEDLRGSLVDLQQSASEAQGQLMSLDQDLESHSESFNSYASVK